MESIHDDSCFMFKWWCGQRCLLQTCNISKTMISAITVPGEGMMMKMRFYWLWTASPKSYIFLSTTHEIKYPHYGEIFTNTLNQGLPTQMSPESTQACSVSEVWSKLSVCMLNLQKCPSLTKRHAVFCSCFWICNLHHLYFITIFDRNVDSEKCFSTPWKVSAQYWWWMTSDMV